MPRLIIWAAVRYQLSSKLTIAVDPIGPVADEIARHIEEGGIKPAVVGHSQGGTVGLMIAARHPDALSRLMVVDMFPYPGMLFAGPGAKPEQVASVAAGIEAGMLPEPGRVGADPGGAVRWRLQECVGPGEGVAPTRIEDSAHFIMWDQPERFRTALKAFLDGR